MCCRARDLPSQIRVRCLPIRPACFGSNPQGQPGGRSPQNPRTRPVPGRTTAGTGPLTGVVQIGAGQQSTCARVGRQARCWGFGPVGDGTSENRSLPVVVLDPSGEGPLTNVAEVATGEASICSRLSNGEVRCWGYYVGDGTQNGRVLPVVVSNPDGTGSLTDVAQVSAGESHTCALLTNGQARCWGSGGNGRLGAGLDYYERTRPVAVISP